MLKYQISGVRSPELFKRPILNRMCFLPLSAPEDGTAEGDARGQDEDEKERRGSQGENPGGPDVEEGAVPRGGDEEPEPDGRGDGDAEGLLRFVGSRGVPADSNLPTQRANAN